MISKKENFLRVVMHDNPEWVPYGYEGVWQFGNAVLEHPPESGVDAFGVYWKVAEKSEVGCYPIHGGNTITDFYQWRDQLKLPDLDAVNWKALKAQADSINRDEYLVSGFSDMGLFERSYLLLGMEEALVNYITETEEMAALLHVLADYKIELIDRYYEACHPDIFRYGDDWGTQNNLFMPVDIWRRTIGKETKRIYDCILRHGMIINQHSCGKIESIFDDLVDMGVKMINPCQPCNDLKRLKQKYGDRICFVGGIDSQHVLDRPGVTAEDVDQEVRKRIKEMATNGGYIATPSHNVPYAQYVMDAMENAIRKYGKYPINL